MLAMVLASGEQIKIILSDVWSRAFLKILNILGFTFNFCHILGIFTGKSKPLLKLNAFQTKDVSEKSTSYQHSIFLHKGFFCSRQFKGYTVTAV